MSSGEGWRLGHRPALDGLRGIAILLVLACHFLDANIAKGRFHSVGAAGVTVFFTLSGFLITSLLVSEADRTGGANLRRFYRHRAVRLLPALLASVVVLGLLQATVNGAGSAWTVLPVVFYVSNWAVIVGANMQIFGPTWSLAIEEQFYLIWPLLLLFARRWRNGPIIVCVAGIAISTALRFSLYNSGDGDIRVYQGSDTQGSSLLIGCLLALLVQRGLMPKVSGRWLPYASTVILFSIALIPNSSFGDLWVPLLVPVLTAALICHICQTVESGPFGWAPLRYTGRRSYALYLWHDPLIWVVGVFVGRSPGWGVLALVLAFGIAELSWRGVERPMQRFRSARPGRVGAQTHVLPAAATS